MRKTILIILLSLPSLLAVGSDTIPQKKSFWQRAYEVVKKFSQIDTTYVEPQKYNFSVMLQNTNNFETYRLKSKDGHEILFAPDPSVKLGPYFGWRWIFLGYTIDINHLGSSSHKQDFNLSLYSNQLGIDIFYRKTGEDYKVRRLKLSDGRTVKEMKNVGFDGFRGSIKGFNAYYIFNHKRFSYPAAYSQSTIQRRSAGSWMAGVGFTNHSLSIDWDRFDDLVTQQVGEDRNHIGESLDSTLLFSRVKYSDLSLSVGYAYNWVFAHNWLFDVSLSLGLSYKYSSSNSSRPRFSFRDFSFRDLNLDGVTRIGVVWNNSRWYAGANAIFHAYNYRKEQFATNNIFGSVNVYFGFNFDRR